MGVVALLPPGSVMVRGAWLVCGAVVFGENGPKYRM
jgi:hypothetical protein